jgi:hypothetical protein
MLRCALYGAGGRGSCEHSLSSDAQEAIVVIKDIFRKYPNR